MEPPSAGDPAPPQRANADRPNETPPSPRATADRRRRRWLVNHFVACFAVLIILVPANYLASPDRPWFLLVMAGWGAPLAVHTAWAIGLIDPRNN